MEGLEGFDPALFPWPDEEQWEYMNTEERFPYMMETFKQAVRCLVGYFTEGYRLDGQGPNNNAMVLIEMFRSWTSDALAFDTLRKLSELIGASGSAAFGRGTQSLYLDVTRASATVRDWDGNNPGHVKLHSNVVALGLLAKKMPVLVDMLGYTADGPLAGSKAADWERHWGRIVPVASLCRYMEGLGMALSAPNVSRGTPGRAARRP